MDLIEKLKTYFTGFLPEVGTTNEEARESWVKNTLDKIPPGARILDAGAGELKYKKYCSHLIYVSQDFAGYDGIGNSSGLQVGSWDQSKLDIISDITSIPEPDESFDAIMCIEVFEHLPNPVLAIMEFHRLLKKGGHLIVTVPFCSLTHFAPYHFYTGFNTYYFDKHLPLYNFDILEIQRSGNYFEYIAQEIWRLPTIAKRYTGLSPWKLEYGILYFILKMLRRFSRKDTDSSEILCFGIFLFAKKNH